MSRRPAYWRTDHQLELKVAEILQWHGRQSGWQPSLPVPIESIIERDFGLRLHCEPIEEGPGEIILGALDRRTKTIILNEAHNESLFERFIGPEAFTYAHELGHWLMDAVDPAQESLFDPQEDERVLCRGPGEPEQHPDARLRERNANRFAAHLLLPSSLVRAAVPVGIPDGPALRRQASIWGVSQATLRIRLGELTLAAPEETAIR